MIAAFFDKPRHLLRNVLKPLLLYKCWPRFFLFFSCSLKETKDLETSSIVSSTAYSWRGKLALERNRPSLSLSDQQRQVDVNMWRCVFFVICSRCPESFNSSLVETSALSDELFIAFCLLEPFRHYRQLAKQRDVETCREDIHLLDLRCVSWLTPRIQPRQR